MQQNASCQCYIIMYYIILRTITDVLTCKQLLKSEQEELIFN